MKQIDAQEEIKSRWNEILEKMLPRAKQPVNGQPSYICPICNHGEHGDGITLNPKSKSHGLKCFGCGFSGSIIDLYMQDKHTDYNTACNDLAATLNIDYERPQAADKKQAAAEDFRNAETEEKAAETFRQPAADYQSYYRQCYKALCKSKAAQDYLKTRGMTGETAKRFYLGYDEKLKRIVIPYSDTYYTARDISSDQKNKYLNPKGATAQLFNAKALESDTDYIFITEGALDALSVIEASGGTAAVIGLGGTPNINLLTQAIKNSDTNKIVIIALDNDDKGAEAAGKLAQQLKDIGTLNISVNLSGQYKDANETLTKDPESLKNAISAAITQAEKSRYQYGAAYYIQSNYAADREKYKKPIPTGFETLDDILNGGLRAGLYTIAAGSSLGKTTLCHQIADNLAERETDVLYFSLEQSAFELVSKSLARLKAIKDGVETDYTGRITSNSDIKAGNADYRSLQEEYAAKVGNRLSIIEGNFGITTGDIKDIIKTHIAYNKRKPVVIIDYLQLIKAEDQQPDAIRFVMDNAVQELKQISRAEEIPIIILAAINRANYLTPISFESIKESGGIEYTSDVVIGLQLACLNDDPIFKNDKKINEKRQAIEAAKSESPRHVQLLILKNRNGKTGLNIQFEYYPLCDLFKEISEFEELTPEQYENVF